MKKISRISVILIIFILTASVVVYAVGSSTSGVEIKNMTKNITGTECSSYITYSERDNCCKKKYKLNDAESF